MRASRAALFVVLLFSERALAAVDDGELGSRCNAPSECATGLTCLSASNDAPGPAGGLCSIPCIFDGACKAYAESALCRQGFCVEGCTFDTPAQNDFDPDKCHGRDDVACTAECIDDLCWTTVDACMPRCVADEQCDSARFCHASTGLCQASAPEGAPPGSHCDDPSAPCLGVCAKDPLELAIEQILVYVCVEPCVVGARLACGGPDGEPARACIGRFATPSDHSGQATGDLGACVAVCDCSSECAEEEVCTRVALGDRFEQKGVCVQGPRLTGAADCLSGSAGASSESECSYGSLRACRTSDCLGSAECLPDGYYGDCVCIDAGAGVSSTESEAPERESVPVGCTCSAAGRRGGDGASFGLAWLGLLAGIRAAARGQRARRWERRARQR